MNIYISHSKNFNFQTELYAPLKASTLAAESNLIFPHDNANVVNAKDLFKSKQCDLVLAEVSYPATGQGIELGWANLLNIPIICAYKTNAKISGSLKFVTKNFIEYSSVEDLVNKFNIINGSTVG